MLASSCLGFCDGDYRNICEVMLVAEGREKARRWPWAVQPAGARSPARMS